MGVITEQANYRELEKGFHCWGSKPKEWLSCEMWIWFPTHFSVPSKYRIFFSCRISDWKHGPHTIDSVQRELWRLWYYLECFSDSFPWSTEIQYDFSSVWLAVDDKGQREMWIKAECSVLLFQQNTPTCARLRARLFRVYKVEASTVLFSRSWHLVGSMRYMYSWLNYKGGYVKWVP